MSGFMRGEALEVISHSMKMMDTKDPKTGDSITKLLPRFTMKCVKDGRQVAVTGLPILFANYTNGSKKVAEYHNKYGGKEKAWEQWTIEYNKQAASASLPPTEEQIAVARDVLPDVPTAPMATEETTSKAVNQAPKKKKVAEEKKKKGEEERLRIQEAALADEAVRKENELREVNKQLEAAKEEEEKKKRDKKDEEVFFELAKKGRDEMDKGKKKKNDEGDFLELAKKGRDEMDKEEKKAEALAKHKEKKTQKSKKATTKDETQVQRAEDIAELTMAVKAGLTKGIEESKSKKRKTEEKESPLPKKSKSSKKSSGSKKAGHTKGNQTRNETKKQVAERPTLVFRDMWDELKIEAEGKIDILDIEANAAFRQSEEYTALRSGVERHLVGGTISPSEDFRIDIGRVTWTVRMVVWADHLREEVSTSDFEEAQIYFVKIQPKKHLPEIYTNPRALFVDYVKDPEVKESLADKAWKDVVAALAKDIKDKNTLKYFKLVDKQSVTLRELLSSDPKKLRDVLAKREREKKDADEKIAFLDNEVAKVSKKTVDPKEAIRPLRKLEDVVLCKHCRETTKDEDWSSFLGEEKNHQLLDGQCENCGEEREETATTTTSAPLTLDNGPQIGKDKGVKPAAIVVQVNNVTKDSVSGFYAEFADSPISKMDVEDTRVPVKPITPTPIVENGTAKMQIDKKATSAVAQPKETASLQVDELRNVLHADLEAKKMEQKLRDVFRRDTDIEIAAIIDKKDAELKQALAKKDAELKQTLLKERSEQESLLKRHKETQDANNKSNEIRYKADREAYTKTVNEEKDKLRVEIKNTYDTFVTYLRDLNLDAVKLNAQVDVAPDSASDMLKSMRTKYVTGMDAIMIGSSEAIQENKGLYIQLDERDVKLKRLEEENRILKQEKSTWEPKGVELAILRANHKRSKEAQQKLSTFMNQCSDSFKAMHLVQLGMDKGVALLQELADQDIPMTETVTEQVELTSYQPDQ